MRKVMLNMKEQLKYDKIKYLIENNSNKQRIALELGITKRQVNRLIITYKMKEKLKEITFFDYFFTFQKIYFTKKDKTIN